MLSSLVHQIVKSIVFVARPVGISVWALFARLSRAEKRPYVQVWCLIRDRERGNYWTVLFGLFAIALLIFAATFSVELMLRPSIGM